MPSLKNISIAVFSGLLTLQSQSLIADGNQKETKSNQGLKATQTDSFTNVNLLDAIRSGEVVARAEGTGDGRMRLTMQNNSKRKLRVILPPGLIASGASGQFGGMG
ncbi:MAG: hypothetical protein ACKO5E_22595, partial [bacterium]